MKIEDYTQETLTELLQTNILDISFVKISDGSIRDMRCTRNSDHIPKDKYPKTQNEDVAPREYQEDIVIVFDLEKKGWRSFSIDNIISVELASV